MTAATLKKLRTITYDANGKPELVILNLKNKMMREAYKKAIEEIEDRLDVEETMRRMNDGSECRPFDEYVKEFNSRKKNVL